MGRVFRPYLTDTTRWTFVGEKTVDGAEAICRLCDELTEKGSPELRNSRVIHTDECIVVEGRQVGVETDSKDGLKYCDVFRVNDEVLEEIVSCCVSPSQSQCKPR